MASFPWESLPSSQRSSGRSFFGREIEKLLKRKNCLYISYCAGAGIPNLKLALRGVLVGAFLDGNIEKLLNKEKLFFSDLTVTASVFQI